MKIKSKKFLSLIPISIAFIMYGTFYFYYEPKLEKRKNILIDEYQKIPPPMATKLVKFNAGYKLFTTWVDADYHTKLNAEEIFSYYRNQLSNNEWFLCRTKDQKNSSEMIFQKNDYAAHIFVRTEKNETKTYVLTITWGSGGCG